MSENFLTRWSRRKQEAVTQDRAVKADDADDAPALPATPQPAAIEPSAADDKRDAPAAAKTEPAFDLASLPSLEEITAETDIRAFLRPGVPADLRLAALRRAWVVDPKVRDFVGLADYDWDFHTPGALPGFGPLAMTDELRHEVTRIVGQWQKVVETAGDLAPDGDAATPVTAPQSAAEGAAAAAEPPLPEALPVVAQAPADDNATPPAGHENSSNPQDFMRCNNNNIASQKEAPPVVQAFVSRRRGHGGALPQ